MAIRQRRKTGIVILAAGNSSRLGQPKQLLEFNNTTLLKNTINEALQVEHSMVIVVTGAQNELIEKEIDSEKVTIAYNPDWESGGMSSSIITGLRKVVAIQPDTESCIFAPCDQPYITAEVFQGLVEEYLYTKKGIIASGYGDTLGIPVMFHQNYFKVLYELEEAFGAKRIIKSYIEDCVILPFEEGLIDIDTPEDYKKLIS